MHKVLVSPARKQRHLFTKSDIVKAVVPINWMNTEKRMNQACPDFAIRQPLPISIVGEVKFFRSGTPKSAVKELYDVARQAMFYLGAFAGEYDSALIVIADASSGHVLAKVSSSSILKFWRGLVKKLEFIVLLFLYIEHES